MESFFELINKIPKSIYETEKGVSNEVITNLISNGRCVKEFPTLNNKYRFDAKIAPTIIHTNLQNSVQSALKIERTDVETGTEAFFGLGANTELNSLIPGETYTFAIDLYVSSTVGQAADVKLQMGDAVNNNWEWVENNLNSNSYNYNEWIRIYCTKTLRSDSQQTDIRIVLNESFLAQDAILVRFMQLECNAKPSLYANEGSWNASWNAGNIAKLFNLFSSEFDELQSVVNDLSMMRSLDNQKGVILDEIGKIIKEPRRGRNDDDYKIILKIAIQRNLSSGSLKTITQITDILSGNADYFIEELHSAAGDAVLDGSRDLNGERLLNPSSLEPAAIGIYFTGDTSGIDKTFYKEVIKEIKSAGVDAEIDTDEEA